MRIVDYMVDIEEISTLLLYLYIKEENTITYNNGLTDLRIRMDDHFNIRCTNLKFPDLPDMNFNDQMTVPYMLGLIDQLRKQKPEIYSSNIISNRWQEINTEVKTVRALNMDQIKKVRKEKIEEEDKK